MPEMPQTRGFPGTNDRTTSSADDDGLPNKPLTSSLLTGTHLPLYAAWYDPIPYIPYGGVRNESEPPALSESHSISMASSGGSLQRPVDAIAQPTSKQHNGVKNEETPPSVMNMDLEMLAGVGARVREDFREPLGAGPQAHRHLGEPPFQQRTWSRTTARPQLPTLTEAGSFAGANDSFGGHSDQNKDSPDKLPPVPADHHIHPSLPGPAGFADMMADAQCGTPHQQETITSSPPSGSTASSDLTASESSTDTEDISLFSRSDLLRELMHYFHAVILPFLASNPPEIFIATASDADANSCSAHNGSSSSSTTIGATNSATSQIATGPSGRLPPALRRKRASDEDEEDDDGGPLLPSVKIARFGQPNRRLACPFFKHNPGLYHDWRSCPGPGWQTVHRVKEHLYRSHIQPIRCRRCHATFKTDEEREIHQTAAERCDVSKKKAPPLDGIDVATREILRKRKKRHAGMTEPEKWKEIYLAIFPDTLADAVPSPYYEYPSGSQSPDSTQSLELARYYDLLRNELPARVRHRLEILIEEALDPIQEILRGQLVGIVQGILAELLDVHRAAGVEGEGEPPGVRGTGTLAASSASPPRDNDPTQPHFRGVEGAAQPEFATEPEAGYQMVPVQEVAVDEALANAYARWFAEVTAPPGTYSAGQDGEDGFAEIGGRVFRLGDPMQSAFQNFADGMESMGFNTAAHFGDSAGEGIMDESSRRFIT